MILSYQSIKACKPLCPMVERTIAHGLSYGLGPAGYDVRIEEDVTLWPGRFVLASTVERFNMPKNILGMVCDKSTWIRRGLSVHNTIIEPGWEGWLTLELKMVGASFIRIKAGTPIAQIVFSFLDQETSAPYRGKYQNQASGVQKALLEGRSNG